MSTPITYYGGKQKLAKCIIKIINKANYKLYIEPFTGGGAVFCELAPKNAILNDTNDFVVAFWRQLHNNKDALIDYIASNGGVRHEAVYKDCGEKYKRNENLSEIEKAFILFYLSCTSFSGALNCGFSYGKELNKIANISNKLNRIKEVYSNTLTIHQRDAIDVIKHYDDENSLFYLDPPYINCSMGHYDGYSNEHYQKLIDILFNIKGKFVLSSYGNDINKPLKDKFNSVNINTLTHAKKGVRDTRVELLIYNFSTDYYIFD